MLDRKCVACRKIKKQNELLRIAKIDNEFVLDLKYKLGGRGAYICKDKECLQLTIKKHLLNRAFKMNVGSSIYDIIGEYEQNC